MPVLKLPPKRDPTPKLPPPRKPGEENPPRKPDEENPPRPMDHPPRELPCVWASKGAAEVARDNAAMANQRSMRAIITLVGAPVCQIIHELPSAFSLPNLYPQRLRSSTKALFLGFPTWTF